MLPAIQGSNCYGYREPEDPVELTGQLYRSPVFAFVFAFGQLILCILACDSGTMDRQDHYIYRCTSHCRSNGLYLKINIFCLQLFTA
jgi:hypothetical protein